MKLNKVIEDIPLYKELYKDLLGSEISTDDLDKLPILTKKHISKFFPENWMTDSLQKAIDIKEYEFMTTSGTSQERLMLIRPKNWWYSIEKRMYSYLKGLFPEYTKLTSKAILTTAICSNTICYIEIPPYEERIINGILHLNITPDPNKWTKGDIERMVEEIDTYQPECFQADPIYLAIFIKLLKKFGIQKPKYTPKCLILTYEFCQKKCLKIIKDFWDIPTSIVYGTTELGFLFYQCPNGIFHWMGDDAYLYLKPLKKKPNYYELVFTSLRNPYMPFINYNTHDVVYIDPEKKCRCGRDEQAINQFMGRAKDITYSKNNEIITVGEIDNELSKFSNNILIYQLDFSYKNKILFKFTTFDDKDLSKEENDQIIDFLLNLYGDSKFSIEMIKEREIVPSASGKFELIRKNNE